MSTVENFPGNLGNDLAVLAKNGWAAEVKYYELLPGYKVRAVRENWAIHFKYPDEDGTFTDGLLFRHAYGQATRARDMSREQMKRFAGMSAEGREKNWGRVTI